MGRGLLRALLESGNEGVILVVALVLLYFSVLILWFTTLVLVYGMFRVVWQEPTQWPHQSPMKVRVLGYILVVAIGVIIYTVVPTTFWVGLWDFMTFPLEVLRPGGDMVTRVNLGANALALKTQPDLFGLLEDRSHVVFVIGIIWGD
jgi:hypothetical protein